MICEAMTSCGEAAVYALTVKDGRRLVACTAHANALDDHAMIVRACRLTVADAYTWTMREARRKSGRCVECSAAAVPGQRRCERHRAIHNERARRAP